MRKDSVLIAPLSQDVLAERQGDAQARLAAIANGTVGWDDVRRYGAALSERVVGQPYNRLPDSVSAQRDRLMATGGAPLVAAFHRAVLLERAVEARQAFPRTPYLQVFQDWHEDAIARMLQDLDERPDVELDWSDDRFAKDVSVAALRMWALGAQVVEPRMGVSRRVIFEGGARTLTRGAATLLRIGGHAPLYEIHTYERHLGEFTQGGWDACYRRIAELLRAEPGVRGVFGASWFFDPAIERVSPRLAYLRLDPLGGGAEFLRIGNTPSTEPLALSKSATRKQLYDEGKYRPEQWLMIWPRAALLRWAGLA